VYQKLLQSVDFSLSYSNMKTGVFFETQYTLCFRNKYTSTFGDAAKHFNRLDRMTGQNFPYLLRNTPRSHCQCQCPMTFVDFFMVRNHEHLYCVQYA